MIIRQSQGLCNYFKNELTVACCCLNVFNLMSCNDITKHTDSDVMQSLSYVLGLGKVILYCAHSRFNSLKINSKWFFCIADWDFCHVTLNIRFFSHSENISRCDNVYNIAFHKFEGKVWLTDCANFLYHSIRD